MIDQSYFNGERQRKFDELVARTKAILAVKEPSLSKIDESKVDLPPLYIEGVKKTLGLEYLVPFYPKAKKIKEIPGDSIFYEVPGNFSREPEELAATSEIVSVKTEVVKSVVNHLMGKGDINLSIGITPVKGFIPPAYYSDSRNGQLKIAVDCVLAVDAMIRKKFSNSYNILVIGSGSPGGVRAGLAYSMIPYMCNANVYMYDPHEVTRVYSVKTERFEVEYKVYGRIFNYDEIARNKKKITYDLVLDDSWTKGISRNDRDLKDMVSTIPEYSVKQFPYERGRKGNIYYQKFYTPGLEERRVSRDTSAISNCDHPLGNCVGCRELRLRLINSYPSSFYIAFFSIHTVNCVTGQREGISVIAEFDGWIEVEPFVIEYDNYCSMNYDYFYGTKMVGVSFSAVKDVRLIFSSRKTIPNRILDEAYQVLVVEKEKGKEKYYVNKIRSEIPFGSKKVEIKEGKINLSHSQGLKDKLEGEKEDQPEKKEEEVIEPLVARKKVRQANNVMYRKKKK